MQSSIVELQFEVKGKLWIGRDFDSRNTNNASYVPATALFFFASSNAVPGMTSRTLLVQSSELDEQMARLHFSGFSQKL